MKEVNFQGLLEKVSEHRVSFKILGMDAKLQEMAYQFLNPGAKRVELKGVISTESKKIKTNPQLGYLFGGLAPLTLKVLRDQGWDITTKELAVDFMKEPLGFIRTYLNEETGETVIKPMSLSVDDRADVNDFIDKLFVFLVVEGAEPMTPEEYKKAKKWK